MGCWAAVLVWLAVGPRIARAEPAPASDELPAGQPTFRVFSGAEGLGNFVIRSMSQDRDGLLWLGTDDGLYRFDGERFTRFSVGEGLISNLVGVVGVSADGGVCAGSAGGLACWDGQRFSQATTRALAGIRVNRLATHAGKLWIGTDGAGLHVADGLGGVVPAPGWPGARGSTIRALWADDQGLVVGDGATARLTSGDGRWRELGDVGLDGERVEGVLRDRAGALWIRTASHLWRLAAGATTAVDLHAGLPADYYELGSPAAMALGPRGEVIVATDVGIAYRERDGWRVVGLAGTPGVPAPIVRTVLVDREGTTWLGAAGLVQLRGRGLVERHGAATGLPGETVWSVQRDRRGALWIGTNRCLARAVARRWECLPGTEGRVVRAMAFPAQGGVFIGGVPSELVYFGPDGRAITTPVARPADAVIVSLTLGAEGDLWITTRTELYRLPGAVAGRAVELVGPPPGPRAPVAGPAIAGDRFWVSTADGAAVLDGGAWRWIGSASGFHRAAIKSVTARADGRLCAVYSEPIGFSCFRYDGAAASGLEHVGPADGLHSGMVYLLGEDRRHRLWVGTGNGVDVITQRGAAREIDHFDERDGLAGADSSAAAFLLDHDGSLWLGATGGVSHVFAEAYEGPPPPPRTVFLDGRLGDRSIQEARLEVPHDHNALSVEFAASSLLDARRLEYQVRLAPLEAAWSTTHQREARYPGFLPGSYRFEVRARIVGGAWGPASALDFVVIPAWWQARGFLVAGGLAGLIVVGAGCAWWLRNRTHQLHARADASFRVVADLMPELISAHRGGELIYLNQALRRLLGLTRTGERWTQAELAERIHPDDRAPLAAMFERVRQLDGERPSDMIELRVRGADGSWRICEVSAINVEIGGARTEVASGRDVTERRRMRSKLLVSDRMASLGTLAAGIAHEINNPLSYVAGNLEVMAEALRVRPEPPSAAERAARDELSAVLSDARDGADRVRKIVQGLRSFSRFDEAERRAPLELASVLEAAIRLTGNEIRHRARLVRELAPAPRVIADDGRLTQVFINLLVNAAHAIPAGRSDAHRITVRTRTDDQGRAVVEVEDTGEGISPELQARVFDPFFTTKEVGEGTGLGLSICHGIITALGGQISLDSAVGSGTLVRIVLPPATGAPTAPAEVVAAPTSAAQPRHRVLLVDDEAKVARAIERLLRRDYDVTIALCGQDALDHVARGVEFDVIVSDVMMPNMTGIELLDELRRVAPAQAARLIFLSGGAFTAQTRQQLDELGVPQLEKPVSASELRSCMTRLLDELPPAPRAP